MRSYLIIAAFATVGLFASEAVAGKVQPVSQETAQSLCKEGGYSAGTTTCGFCHGSHCHTVDCNENGKCYNTTYSPPRAASGGGKTGVSTGTVASGQAGVKTGNNPPPKGVVSINHPVMGAGNNQSSMGGGNNHPVMESGNHQGGGGSRH